MKSWWWGLGVVILMGCGSMSDIEKDRERIPNAQEYRYPEGEIVREYLWTPSWSERPYRIFTHYNIMGERLMSDTLPTLK